MAIKRSSVVKKTQAPSSQTFAAREGTKRYVKNNYGVNVSDSDITWKDGEVYLYGQSLGKADKLDTSAGRAYYTDADAVKERIDSIIGAGADPFRSAAFNRFQKDAGKNSSAITREYGNYLDSARDRVENGDYLDPKVEAAIKSAFGYKREADSRDALAQGAERNGGNIDSLSVQNRANYRLNLDAQVAQALISAMGAQSDIDLSRLSAYAQGLKQYGDYNNELYRNNLTLDQNDLARQEQDRLDRQQTIDSDNARRSFDLQRAELFGSDVRGSLANPYLDENGQLTGDWESLNYRQIANDNLAKAEQYTDKFIETGDLEYKDLAQSYYAAASQAQQAHNIKAAKPGFTQYSSDNTGSAGGVSVSDAYDNSIGRWLENRKLGYEDEANRRDNETALRIAVSGNESAERQAAADADAAVSVARIEAQADITKAQLQAEAEKYGYDIEEAIQDKTISAQLRTAIHTGLKASGLQVKTDKNGNIVAKSEADKRLVEEFMRQIGIEPDELGVEIVIGE